MQLEPEQSNRMRVLAAELRRAAASTSLADYQVKFEQTARELEDEARLMERRPRLAS
jgi:hypothetical protein